MLDDLAVARAVKRAGGRVGVADGADLAACRMYEGWADLSAGYRKSLWAAFGPAPASAAVAAALALAYVVPPLAALRGSRAGLVGYGAAVASRVLAAGHSGGRAWPDALAHPVSVAALLGLLASSWRGHRRGELTWKGRRLAGGSAPGRALTWRGSSSSARASGGWPPPPGSRLRGTGWCCTNAPPRTAASWGSTGATGSPSTPVRRCSPCRRCSRICSLRRAGLPTWSSNPSTRSAATGSPTAPALDLPFDPAAVPAALDSALGPGSGAAWQAFHDRSARLWDLVGEPVLHRPLRARDLARFSARLRDLRVVAPWLTLRRLGEQLLPDPRLRMWLDRYATYSGSDPRRAPSVLSVTPYVEQRFGSWWVRGGLRRLGDALLERCHDLGVEVHLDSPVAEVTTAGRRVSGVRLADGRRVPADVVVSATPTPAIVYERLLL